MSAIVSMISWPSNFSLRSECMSRLSKHAETLWNCRGRRSWTVAYPVLSTGWMSLSRCRGNELQSSATEADLASLAFTALKDDRVSHSKNSGTGGNVGVSTGTPVPALTLFLTHPSNLWNGPEWKNKRGTVKQSMNPVRMIDSGRRETILTDRIVASARSSSLLRDLREDLMRASDTAHRCSVIHVRDSTLVRLQWRILAKLFAFDWLASIH